MDSALGKYKGKTQPIEETTDTKKVKKSSPEESEPQYYV